MRALFSVFERSTGWRLLESQERSNPPMKGIRVAHYEARAGQRRIRMAFHNFPGLPSGALQLLRKRGSDVASATCECDKRHGA